MTNPDQSHVNVGSGGTSFVGPDAVNLFRAATLKGALKMYAACKIVPTRGVTATSMLKMATPYTGKTYKRGEHAKAAEDMTAWIETMKAALPIFDNGVQR